MRNETGKILLVEDDETLRFIVKDNLEQNNYQVDTAEDGEQALQLYSNGGYAIIILDVMLPKTDGFTVAKKIREKDEATPILFLTARAMTEDRITGLTIGGDDYITKPFSMEELMLKIKIFLRRSQVISQNDYHTVSKSIKIGQFIFRPDELQLQHNKTSRKLTLKESELIQLFAANSNRVLSRGEILEKIWGSNDYFLGRSLDVFISRLRKYFKDDPAIKIVNIHGLGFRFSVKKEN
ncbi:Two-component transcriptional response regulator, winged helix family [hydrothermal vent metagenome]|uniref:Two-component transcriptional response regulator, winged helix family n=1 Tax=hydrothermal vent metagenome TaxID=652676 RepID=A0A3B0TDG9_9ZZZZ